MPPAEVYTDFGKVPIWQLLNIYIEATRVELNTAEVDQYVVNVDKKNFCYEQMHGGPVEEAHQRCFTAALQDKSY